MRWLAGTGLLLLVAISGCAAPGQSDPEHELRVARNELERTRAALTSERNRADALQERLDRQQKVATTQQAEINSLKERIDALEAANAELLALMEAETAQPVEAPEVRISPLPEKLDEALAEYAQRLGERVTYDRARGGLTFANDRLFGSGSAQVRSDAVAGLTELAVVLAQAIKDYPDEHYDIVVVGHTDNQPITRPATQARHPTNWHLSVHRAIGVKDELVRAGVPESHVGVMGFSAFRPVSDERERNRRVEVFLVPRGGVRSFEPVKPGSGR